MDFDEIIDRHGTFSTQWDYAADRFGSSDVLPFSISDADFAVPDEILSAMRQRMEHPIFGYTRWNHDSFKKPIVDWFARRGGASISSDWIVYSPSVIYTVGTLIRLLSQPGDTVVTFSPMYDAFFGMIQGNGRKLASVPISSAMDGYGIDWKSLERACSSSMAKVLVLTNPHNPTGKVFSRAELGRIADICMSTRTFLISDDIHRDIVIGDVPYTPVTEIMQEHVALACSSSKTFNTAGLIGSYAFIPDEELRENFLFELKQRNALSSVSILGMYAQMAGYQKCDEYVDKLCDYILGNMQLISDYLSNNIPSIRFSIPEGTYLAWMDVSGLKADPQRLQDVLVKVGHVGIMNGEAYGDGQFLRMCVACPRKKLEAGLSGLLAGVQSL